MDLLPHSFFSFKIGKEDLMSKDEYLDYTWGLAIEETKIENFNIKIQDYIEYIPAKTCVSSIILSDNDKYLRRDLFQFMLEYIEKNNYIIEGDIFGKIIIITRDGDKKKSYLEVNIPVR